MQDEQENAGVALEGAGDEDTPNLAAGEAGADFNTFKLAMAGLRFSKQQHITTPTPLPEVKTTTHPRPLA